jgi:DNA-binding transcriptional LysR family regulator
MQIETFKVFRDLVETSSFSKAAVMNAITQSAVSQQIRALETRFGVVLIDRGRRHFALTPEGAVFLDASKDVLRIYNSLGDRLKELLDVVAGEIKLASIFSIGLHELPPVLKAFRGAYPDVEVEVEYRRSSEVYGLVVGGEVDMGLVSYPVKRNGIQIEPFMKDRLVVICHPGHELAKKRRVNLKDLEGQRFIGFEPDLPTRKAIDRQFREGGVTIQQVMEFDNIETVKRAVEIETGVSIVPGTTVEEEVDDRNLVAIPIEDPEMWRPLGILLKRNRTRSPALKRLVSLLKEAHGRPGSVAPATEMGELEVE